MNFQERFNSSVAFLTLLTMGSFASAADYFAEDFSGATIPATLEQAPGSEDGLAPVYGGAADWTGVSSGGSGTNRSYVRTVASDYSSASFRAEITVTHAVTGGAEGDDRNGVFGFGTGQRQDDSHLNGSSPDGSQFGLPTAGPVIYIEATTQFNGGYLVRGWEKEPDAGGSFGSITGLAFMVDDTDTPVSMTDGGTHRIRMDYDAVLDTLHYSVDVDYTGGPFVADTVMDSFAVNAIGANGQGIPEGALGVRPSELLTYQDTENFGDLRDTDELGDPVEFKSTNSHIFFGGSNVQFDDLSIVLTGALPGDYTGDGVVNAADYTKWRDTLGSTSDLAADGDGSGTVDAGDYDFWKDRFGDGAGAGSLTAAQIPEPHTLGLLGLLLVALSVRRRVAP